jgi:hypothetical protein
MSNRQFFHGYKIKSQFVHKTPLKFIPENQMQVIHAKLFRTMIAVQPLRLRGKKMKIKHQSRKIQPGKT